MGRSRNGARILVTESLGEAGLGVLEAFAAVDVRRGLAPKELQAILGEYDALVVRSGTKVTAELLAAGRKLRGVGRALG